MGNRATKTLACSSGGLVHCPNCGLIHSFCLGCTSVSSSEHCICALMPGYLAHSSYRISIAMSFILFRLLESSLLLYYFLLLDVSCVRVVSIPITSKLSRTRGLSITMGYTRLCEPQPADEDINPPNSPVSLEYDLAADEHANQPPRKCLLSPSTVSLVKLSSRSESNVHAKVVMPTMRYRWRAVYLLLFYVPLLVIPWILTCVLTVRPINVRSYINQASGLSLKEIRAIELWVDAVQVLNSIATVVTIPIMSTLLAQAAVVYSQRRRAGQRLSISQTFALADRGWSDIIFLFGSGKANASSAFLWFAAFLMMIGKLSSKVAKYRLRHPQLPYNPLFKRLWLVLRRSL